MQIITVIGIVSAALTIAYFVIYFVGASRSRPEFIVRFSGIDSASAPIFGYRGYLNVGVSTHRREDVVLRAIEIECLTREPVQFREDELFKIEASGSRITVGWYGEKRIRRNQFTIFAVPYEAPAAQRAAVSSLVFVALTGAIAPQHWGKPWSMFSLSNTTMTLTKKMIWKPQPDVGEETGFKLEPLQSAEIFGKAAEDAMEAHTNDGDLNLEVLEMFKDGSYSRKTIQKSPVATPSPESPK
jgi:hypothetical protein